MSSAEIQQVYMVGEHNHQVKTSFQVVTSFIEGMNYCKEFTIKDLIIPFSGVERLGEITT